MAQTEVLLLYTWVVVCMVCTMSVLFADVGAGPEYSIVAPQQNVDFQFYDPPSI